MGSGAGSEQRVSFQVFLQADRMRALFSIFGILSVVVTANLAQAEGPVGSATTKKFRLSQADFDQREISETGASSIQPINPVETLDNVVEPADVIRDVRSIKRETFDERATRRFAKPEIAPQKPIYTESVPIQFNAADASTARSMLGSSTEKVSNETASAIIGFGITDNQFITPRLKGPSTDRGNQNVVTSKTRWTFKRSNGGSCGQPGTPEMVAKKVEALKEILNRFTGNDDFYDSQCNEPCAGKGQTSVLGGLSVTGGTTTEFEIEQKGIECFYQLKRKVGTPWQTLQRTEATCFCH
jgi:hypothetical protein